MHPSALPPAAGVAFKPMHFAEIVADPAPLGFLEIHAENYMGAGGPPHAQLTRLRERYALSVHGVGLSLGGAAALDPDHLRRLKALCDRYQPAAVSEHLAWAGEGGLFLGDLLPLPYTPETLALVVDHVDRLQDHLGRQVLIENPARYLAFAHSTIPEPEFLAELVRRGGCGLLLDVNNVHVSAINLGFAAGDYLAAFPLHAVGEIHLAGHAVMADRGGAPLLIDSHAAPVAGAVWSLYDEVLARRGPVATLIERDGDVPAWPVLRAEAMRAQLALDEAALDESALDGVARRRAA